MKCEQIYGIMGCIDPDLIEAADGVKKRRIPRRLRIVLIAACLCAALAAAAGAAVLNGVFSGGAGSFEAEGVIYEGTRILPSGIMPFSKDQFHAEFWTKAAERQAENLEIGEDRPLEYLSWEKAAEEMGISLAESDYLEKNGVSGFCSVYFLEAQLEVHSVYRVDGQNIGVMALIQLENEQDVGLKDGFVFAYGDGRNMNTERFAMPDGSAALIIEGGSIREENGCSYTGCFVKDGIFYMVSIEDVADGEEGRALLEKILGSIR